MTKSSQERMAAATSFYTTFQQLMLSMGICAGAAALQGAMVLRGHHAPQFADFTAAFWTVATVSLDRHHLEPALQPMKPAPRSAATRRAPGPTRQVIKEPRGLNS